MNPTNTAIRKNQTLYRLLEDVLLVPDYQLSLAIGKEGQNARLAAKLTGYKIDIKPASAPLEPIVAEEDSLFEQEEVQEEAQSQETED